jgi:hypothetical protein
MREIKSFNIFQTAKVVGVLYGISFLLMAIVELLVFTTMGQASGHPGPKPPFVLMIIVLPIFGTIFSFIGVAFGCWLYNVIAPHIGGIAFELSPSARTNGPSN